MNKKYPHLLSPIKIGSVFTKNRMGMARAVPTFATGVEDAYPLDTAITYVGNMAKNGAAIVTCPSPTWKSEYNRPGGAFMPPPPDDGDGPFGPGAPMPGEMQGLDMDIANVRTAFSRMAEAIHNHGSLACISLMEIEPMGWDINDIPLEYLEKLPEIFAQKCALYRELGFDIGCFYMSYRNSLLCNSISPRNERTDKYGGSTMEERARLSLEVFSSVRTACPGFLIEVQVSGEEGEGGYMLDDLIEYARLGEGLIDILQIRGKDANIAHPTGFNSIKHQPPTLRYAEALKKSGTSIVIAPVGGFQNPKLNDEYIASGKADMIYMARAFICDSEYGKKIVEGDIEDIIPCIRCNKCHSKPGDPEAGCSVNPKLICLLTDREFIVCEPAEKSKKVAVIGGGPAGMEAALTAARRGHRVTLYEMGDSLGGQLLHADYVSFKWPLMDFKDYMISQLEKSSVDVCMGVKATPEILRDEGFDAILLATGANPVIPNIPGTDSKNVWTPISVFGREAELGRRVVVVGGAETGTETALHLALCGHEVMLLTRRGKIAHNAQGVHYREIFEEKWQSVDTFGYKTKATAMAIGDGYVNYVDVKGGEHSIEADSIVLCGGMSPVQEMALEFAAMTDHFRMIGDCRAVGDVRTCMKNAYTAAHAL